MVSIVKTLLSIFSFILLLNVTKLLLKMSSEFSVKMRTNAVLIVARLSIENLSMWHWFLVGKKSNRFDWCKSLTWLIHLNMTHFNTFDSIMGSYVHTFSGGKKTLSKICQRAAIEWGIKRENRLLSIKAI